jgi:hypothetical protein
MNKISSLVRSSAIAQTSLKEGTSPPVRTSSPQSGNITITRDQEIAIFRNRGPAFQARSNTLLENYRTSSGRTDAKIAEIPASKIYEHQRSEEIPNDRKLLGFGSDFVIVGEKTSGVEGGCIIRRVWTAKDDAFSSPDIFSTLCSLSENSPKLLPEAYRSKDPLELQDLLAHEDRDGPIFSQIRNAVMNNCRDFQVTFMAKVLFGEEDICGDTFLKPNAKNAIHKHYTARTLPKINKEILEEYTALTLGKLLTSGGTDGRSIVPEVKLGQVGDDGRLFLMTEMVGSDTPSETKFSTFEDTSQDAVKRISNEIYSLAYMLSIGLLNDRDSNKSGNMGILQQEGQENRISLFDLGHPDPTGFELNKDTLLPKFKGSNAIVRFLYQVLSWVGIDCGKFAVLDPIAALNKEQKLNSLRELVSHQDDIMTCLKEIRNSHPQGSDEYQVIDTSIHEFEARLSYLGKLIEEINLATTAPEIDPTTTTAPEILSSPMASRLAD